MTEMTWIERNPNATRIERIRQLAHELIGTAREPSEWLLEYVGLEPEFVIYDEPMKHCLAFDEIVMRCEGCDWWTDTDAMDEDGYCEDCSEDYS
jgi:hypothetical protein